MLNLNLHFVIERKSPPPPPVGPQHRLPRLDAAPWWRMRVQPVALKEERRPEREDEVRLSAQETEGNRDARVDQAEAGLLGSLNFRGDDINAEVNARWQSETFFLSPVTAAR